MESGRFATGGPYLVSLKGRQVRTLSTLPRSIRFQRLNNRTADPLCKRWWECVTDHFRNRVPAFALVKEVPPRKRLEQRRFKERDCSVLRWMNESSLARIDAPTSDG